MNSQVIITSLASKKGTHWLVLEDHLYLGIDMEQTKQFKDLLKQKLKTNEKIIVRGKPYYHDKHWRIKLRHPWQLIRRFQLKNKKNNKRGMIVSDFKQQALDYHALPVPGK
eukprot:TRINITY_DN5179_c0_g1_i1.p1 TRINITY_DN5179_c0_g1~~TRINITY_DN5179_c0_g1_i1.p1  ORF type:complete len:111 (-),score=2.93 TRINITY_DN5179_c0_g1_i1:171-503(-)